MSVPNGPAGGFVPAQNPTRNGSRVSASPSSLTTPVPAAESDVIDWDPVAAQAIATATTPTITAFAGILAADGSQQPGSLGPPFVSGDIPVGVNQVATSVLLKPENVS